MKAEAWYFAIPLNIEREIKDGDLLIAKRRSGQLSINSQRLKQHVLEESVRDRVGEEWGCGDGVRHLLLGTGRFWNEKDIWQRVLWLSASHSRTAKWGMGVQLRFISYGCVEPIKDVPRTKWLCLSTRLSWSSRQEVSIQWSWRCRDACLSMYWADGQSRNMDSWDQGSDWVTLGIPMDCHCYCSKLLIESSRN